MTLVKSVDAEKKSKPWQWPSEWIRDEKFWREVTTRSASGIIVLFLGYWAAVWLGYIRQPNALKSAFETTYLIVLLLTTVIIVDRYSSLRVAQKLAARMNKWLARLVSMLMLTVFNLSTVALEYFVLLMIFSFIKTVLGIDQGLR